MENNREPAEERTHVLYSLLHEQLEPQWDIHLDARRNRILDVSFELSSANYTDVLLSALNETRNNLGVSRFEQGQANLIGVNLTNGNRNNRDNDVYFNFHNYDNLSRLISAAFNAYNSKDLDAIRALQDEAIGSGTFDWWRTMTRDDVAPDPLTLTFTFNLPPGPISQLDIERILEENNIMDNIFDTLEVTSWVRDREAEELSLMFATDAPAFHNPDEEAYNDYINNLNITNREQFDNLHADMAIEHELENEDTAIFLEALEDDIDAFEDDRQAYQALFNNDNVMPAPILPESDSGDSGNFVDNIIFNPHGPSSSMVLGSTRRGRRVRLPARFSDFYVYKEAPGEVKNKRKRKK